jgi:hypothetical protein
MRPVQNPGLGYPASVAARRQRNRPSTHQTWLRPRRTLPLWRSPLRSIRSVNSVGRASMSARKSRGVTPRESQCESAHNPPMRRTNRPLKVVQCDQTPILASSTMLGIEEVRRPFQTASPSFFFTVRLQHGNRIDCSFGAVCARWRGLGILSLAWLARSQDGCDYAASSYEVVAGFDCGLRSPNPLSGLLN